MAIWNTLVSILETNGPMHIDDIVAKYYEGGHVSDPERNRDSVRGTLNTILYNRMGNPFIKVKTAVFGLPKHKTEQDKLDGLDKEILQKVVMLMAMANVDSEQFGVFWSDAEWNRIETIVKLNMESANDGK